jgi:hypothetical protein
MGTQIQQNHEASIAGNMVAVPYYPLRKHKLFKGQISSWAFVVISFLFLFLPLQLAQCSRNTC